MYDAAGILCDIKGEERDKPIVWRHKNKKSSSTSISTMSGLNFFVLNIKYHFCYSSSK